MARGTIQDAETITAVCECGCVIYLPSTQAGRSTRCPDCRTLVRAPGSIPGGPSAPADWLAIASGLLLVGVAAVWLVAGLQAGKFFYYGPPLVFGIGLGRIFQGLPGPDPSSSGAPPC